MTLQAEDMRGKVALITGASSGIGLETARALAAAGAGIVMVCRDRARAEAARAEIATAGPRPRVLIADLASQPEIHSVADELRAAVDRIDVLVNNAGAIFERRVLTDDGIERTFALNHLAPFLLTNLVIDLLRDAPQGRVVTVASEAHSRTFDFDNLQGERSYRFFRNYAISKTANILFAYELARRLEPTSISSNAVSPGPTRTRFGDNMTGAAAWFPRIMKRMPFFVSAEKGSRTAVWAASSPELAGVSGRFYMRCKERKSKPITRDVDVARRLWALSEELCGLEPSSRLHLAA
jgi:retinol dehydrogenase 12